MLWDAAAPHIRHRISSQTQNWDNDHAYQHHFLAHAAGVVISLSGTVYYIIRMNNEEKDVCSDARTVVDVVP